MSKYAISTDEERYTSLLFNTREEAIEQGNEEFDGEGFFVGEARPPVQPEDLFSVDDWLETVSCHDEYDTEWGDCWDRSTKAQRKQLEDAIKVAMAVWLNMHNLRPKFYSVTNAEWIPSVDENIEKMRKETTP